MASKNLFSGEGVTETDPTTLGSAGGAFTSIEERDETTHVWGPSQSLAIESLPFDFVGALSSRPVPYYAEANRVMSLRDARKRLRGLMQHVGVHTQSDAIQLSFFEAMHLAYAKNSGSVIQPGRAAFGVQGGATLNFFTDVVQFLGEDMRRFFRAYADFTRRVIRKVLDQYGQGDRAQAENYRDIMWVATDRGLARYPDLIGDNAEACTNLSKTEAVVIRQSKASLLSTNVNVADMVQTYGSKSSPQKITHYDPFVASAGGQEPEY